MSFILCSFHPLTLHWPQQGYRYYQEVDHGSGGPFLERERAVSLLLTDRCCVYTSQSPAGQGMLIHLAALPSS